MRLISPSFFLAGSAVFSQKVEKISNLRIDVDDYVDILALTENSIHIKIHQNYLYPLVKRGGEIIFEDGLLEYDFPESTIHFTGYKTKERKCIYAEKENYDRQYELQMQHFINGITGQQCSMSEEIQNMKVIRFSEISSIKRAELCLD